MIKVSENKLLQGKEARKYKATGEKVLNKK